MVLRSRLSVILPNCLIKCLNDLAMGHELIYNFATSVAVTTHRSVVKLLTGKFSYNTSISMIKIPFDRCVILTTLDFDRIIDRLESEIYDRRFEYQPKANRSAKHQRYYGDLHGFKFLATRMIGCKYLHLPGFLLPSVEGTIDHLHNGYEISLNVKLNNWTFILLLTWLGGLFTFTMSSLLDNMLGDVKDYRYLSDVGISIGIYLAIVGYFYFAAWRATKFFKSLFAQRLLGTTSIVAPQQNWLPSIQRQQLALQRSSVDWMRKNLPSFPSTPDARKAAMSGKMPDRSQKQDEWGE